MNMTQPFAARITRSPLPFDPDDGARAQAEFADLAPEVAQVIGGAAGCSPYLRDLLGHEGGWIREALEGPEAALEAALRFEADGEEAIRRELRVAKRRVALLAGLCDLAGVWPLETVTGALSKLADAATHKALTFQVGREIARGKLPGMGEADVESAGGAVAIAMGKGGAFELNYSSDIDLILLFDESRYARDEYGEARASLIRAARRMSAMLSELTADGYVFRTDLRLRPDPATTPVILAMEAAERYYESLGRTWERAAYIKARAAAGDIAAGEVFLARLTPFVWRKHLDFAAIQDAHDMRLRIRAHKGLGGAIQLPGHDMKLGRGGIREIEFFTQTRQLISGGRDESLRDRRTVPALAALAAKGWVPEEVAETLTGHYRDHREIEHRVQMVRDAQTHKLPGTDDGFQRLANMFGEGDAAALKARLSAALEEVHALTEGFFAPEERDAAQAAEIAPEDAEIVERWAQYPALRSARAVEIFERLKPELMGKLGQAARPREALVHFDSFLAGLPAGVQLFSLFEANPHLVDLMVDIAATSPALSAYLGRNSQVLDGVIGGDFFADWPGEAALSAELSQRLQALGDDYEAQLDMARRWQKEWHFRIGVHYLRGLTRGPEAAEQYSELADAVVQALWGVVVAHFATKHGPPPGKGAVLIGMGSLGARTISASSDLDLIVIYDADGVEFSEGKRPLATRAYYARLTQAMVTALSAPMPEGRLYEVDMRLRPSGKGGPVATSLAAFESYQREEAWTWEHLALTRARAVAGNAQIGAEVARVREAVLNAPCDADKILSDVRDMRARIEAAKGAGSALEAKVGAGRLQDIELLAQTAALLAPGAPLAVSDQIAAGEAIGWLTAEEAAALNAAYSFLWHMQEAGKLLTEGPLDPENLGAGGQAFLLRETGCEDLAGLEARVAGLVSQAAQAVDAALARPVEAGR